MSDQEVFNIGNELTMGLGYAMDPWTESQGKCVDTQYFDAPEAQYIIEDGDRFIGRTQCHKRCKANLECVAFHAENNSLETGECVMLRDGPGTWIGDGPKDKAWHCHVDKARDSDNSGSDNDLLLSMLEEMEQMII